MTVKSKRLLNLLVAVVFTSAMSTAPVVATDNLNARWYPYSANGYQSWILWHFGTSFPTNSSMRTYVSNGRLTWNNAHRQLWFSWDQNASPKVNVTYEDLLWPNQDALAIGMTLRCGGGYTAYICSGSIAVNSTPGNWKHWYGQTTLACPYVDLESTAAHEWGHIVSLTHTNQSSDDVMYPNIPCGTMSKRDLTSHDLASISALYPAH